MKASNGAASLGEAPDGTETHRAAAARLDFCATGALSVMTNERKTNGDTPSPEIRKDGSNGDGTEKPGLVIDVVLPNEKPDVERDPNKQN